jgi:hypothetical protein
MPDLTLPFVDVSYCLSGDMSEFTFLTMQFARKVDGSY